MTEKEYRWEKLKEAAIDYAFEPFEEKYWIRLRRAAILFTITELKKEKKK